MRYDDEEWRTWARSVSRRLDLIVNLISTERTETMATLADLQAKVAAVADTEDAAAALISGLAQKIQDLINSGGGPDQFQALVDQLTQHTDPLAAAVVANKPE